MRLIRYPLGTLLALLETDFVTAPTRDVLRERLESETIASGKEATPQFFDADAFATLRAACDRLLPQRDRPEAVDLAGAIDRRLAEGRGNGWRYDVLPPDGDAFRAGLRGLDETARRLCGRRFHEIDPALQFRILGAVQRDEVSSGVWQSLSPCRFFEELLAEVCEIYYSHPLAQEEIGYAGMADARGWPGVGLNQLAGYEPRALGGAE